MPSRLLRETILDSDAVNSLSPQAEVFYRRLMSAVDDFGRFDGRPAVLRSRLYALQLDRVREADVVRWIAECEKANLIRLYTVTSKPYLTFHKLGDPRAKASKYPNPPEGDLIASENICAHMRADVPDSYSDSPTDSYSDSIPLNPQSVDDGFAAFWTAYGRKENKQKAIAAWKKLSPDSELQAAILAGIEAWSESDQWAKNGGKFIPHASTWLNGRRWEDEIVSGRTDLLSGLKEFNNVVEGKI